MGNTNTLQTYTRDDVKKHNSKDDCWIILDDHVYDITEFIPKHSGGGLYLILLAGKDITKDFNQLGHSSSHKRALKKYIIGVVDKIN